jgi:hypothetical protein
LFGKIVINEGREMRTEEKGNEDEGMYMGEKRIVSIRGTLTKQTRA